jgi:hypothetical protein
MSDTNPCASPRLISMAEAAASALVGEARTWTTIPDCAKPIFLRVALAVLEADRLDLQPAPEVPSATAA